MKGASQNIGSIFRDLGPNPDRVLIGASRNGSVSSFNWKGCVDEVAIYDTALSLAQIRAHFRAGAPGPDFTDIDHRGNSTTMSFTTLPDFFHRIETSRSLPQWFQLGDPVPGDWSVQTATDPAAGLRNFYRIRRLP